MKRLKVLCSVFVLIFSASLLTGCSAKVESIEIVNNSVSTNLVYGEDLDLNQLQIVVEYDNDTNAILDYEDFSSEISIDTSNIQNTVPGDYDVTITYKEVSTEITITVLPAHVTGFEIDRTNIPTAVGFGTAPDWSNLIVKKVYADNSKITLTRQEYLVDATAFNPNEAGTYAISVSYGSYPAQTFNVTVMSAAVVDFRIDRSLIPTEVAYGTTPDWSLLKVYAVCEDTSEQLLQVSEYTLDTSEFDANTPDTYTITVAYSNFDDKTFDVVVNELQVVGFEIDRSSIPASVGYGTEIDWSNLIVKKVFADNSKEVLESTEYSIDSSLYNPYAVGTYTITVNYSTFAAQTFNVQVITASSSGSSFAYEGETLVIFKDIEYNLGSVTNLSYIKEGETTPVNVPDGETLTITEIGLYTLNYTSGSDDKSRDIKVVPWISTFTVGQSLTLYNNNTSDSSSFISENVQKYLVGTGTPFYFDIKLNNNYMVDSDYIDFAFVVDKPVNGELTGSYLPYSDFVTSTVQDATYGSGFVFNEAYVGSAVRATIHPKYNDRTPIIFEFILNDGVNVFDDAGLKQAYADFDVQNINIHRTIVATLEANQLNSDGSPINYINEVLIDKREIDPETVNGNVYYRYSNSTTNDNLVINGNYQTVDGSNLPLIVVDLSRSEQCGYVSGSDEVVQSQISIFRYDVYDASIVEDASVTTSAAFDSAMNNSVVYNNLLLVGNTEAPETSQGHQLLVNSGSYSGMRAQHADMTANNCIVKNCAIGFYMNYAGCDGKLQDTKIYECWANLVYGWASNKIELSNSTLSTAGGSAVWLEDPTEGGNELETLNFVMDEESVIDNMVAGTEAWFVAYSMTTVATALKSTIENNVNPVGKTVLQTKEYTDANNQPQLVSKFNFTVVIIDKFDDVPLLNPSSGSITVGNITTQLNYEDAAPAGVDAFLYDIEKFPASVKTRALEVQAYLMSEAGGKLDARTAWNQARLQAIAESEAVQAQIPALVEYYMSQGMDQQTATNAAVEAAVSQAILAVVEYLDVVSSVPGQGKIHTIMPLYDLEA